MIEQNSMLDTVDHIYKKAKVQSKAKVGQITQDVFEILQNGREPMSLVGLVAEKEMRDEENLQESIRLQADKEMLEGSSMEAQQQRMQELDDISRRFNIKIKAPTKMPPQNLVYTYAQQSDCFLKYKKLSNMTRVLGLDQSAQLRQPDRYKKLVKKTQD